MEHGQTQFKNYFLGNLSEEEIAETEMQILADQEFAETMEIVETDLIEEYLDGELSADDRKSFEEKYLTCEPRLKKVEFLKSVKKFAESQSTIINEPTPSFFETLKTKFNLRPLTLAFGAIALICAVSVTSWFVWKNSTNKSVSVLALNNYQKQKNECFNSRISELECVPTEGTRGGFDENKNDSLKVVEAKAIILVQDNPTAENLHELGRVYLVEDKFDEAIKEFDKAIKLNPNIAKLRNDLGVALLEKGRLAKAKCNDGNEAINKKCGDEKESYSELFSNAGKEFEYAIELDKNLIEAYFNQALCADLYEFFPNKAKEAWENYLKIDSTSKWADKARERLQNIKESISKDISALELENEFLDAFRQQKSEIALKIVSESREIIKKKYLPQKLAMSYLESKDSEKFQALKYLGQIEKEKIQDNFAFDLSDYYASTNNEELTILRKAQNYVGEGYSLCLKDDFSGALNKFTLAKKLFLQASNFIEANTVCDHFIAYCLYNTDKKEESLAIFSKVSNYCRVKNYKWFYIMNFYWFMGWNSGSFDYQSITQVKNDYEKGLELAKEIEDSFMTQKYLISLASRCFLIKQQQQMLNYLQQSFEVSMRPRSSLRQKFRNFSDAAEMLSSTNLDGLLKLVVGEEIEIAKETKDDAFVVYSQLDAGIVKRQTNDFEESRKTFIEAEKNVENVKEESEKKELLAQIYLNWGHLEREAEHYDESAQLYDKSVVISESLETPVFLYETKKSKLLAYQSLGNTHEVETQLPAVIELAEKYRDKILEEQERHSFFDNQQSVYDIATQHYLNLGEPEKAFDYAELSSSRSLLDWLERGAQLSSENKNLEVLFNESQKPLTINEIREKMPPEVQIVQYSVLEKKILIWLVSKEKFIVISSETTSDNLRDKVTKYLTLIKSKNIENRIEIDVLSKELYQDLILPILSSLDKNKEICFVPSNILFQLPFSALISPDGKYLLNDFTLFYAPSSNVFLMATENAAKKLPKSSETILSIGNPLVNAEYFPNLQDLPSSANEAQEIASNYDSERSKVLTGKEAGKTAFQSLYKDFDVIHVAAHYIIEEGSPLLSGLVLANEGKTKEANILTNSELLGSKLLKTKLVILSACQTAVEGYFNGEGMIGLSRTFLSAGVPLAVASGWKVDSVATDELMKNFHRYRVQGKLSTAKALRKAQLDMLSDAQGEFNSPYFWSAFSVYGGYASF
jgi:CHAT domain-containing protein